MSITGNIPSELGLDCRWETKNGSMWLTPEALDVRRMAAFMRWHGARFITITAMQLPGTQTIRMDYHWDLDGELLTFTTQAADNRIAAISDLCEAAGWVEREIHEYFAVDFDGQEYEPLLLRAGDPVGINLHKEDE
jgi:NADH:ubiquinone oxidoreductase subunit C